MFKEKSTEEIIKLVEEQELDDAAAINRAVENAFKDVNVQTKDFDMNIKNDEITIAAKKQDNHTLKDLRQKLINDLYNQQYYSECEVEILKILFENN